MRIRLLAAMTLFVGVVLATVHVMSAPETAELAAPSVDGPVGDLIHQLVLDGIPHEYEDTRKWGGTKRVWDGLKVEVDGLRIKTKRRWKDARHGTWKRYRMWLINPEDEFQIQLENVQRTPDRKIACDLVVDAHVGIFGRLSEFRRDVQLISLSDDAESVVRMRLGCELSGEFGIDGNLSPQITLKPQITDADLQLTSFKLHRLSQINGSVADEFGGSLHKILQREINRRRGKIVEKANRAITKNSDHLTLSIGDIAASGWEKLLGSFQ